MNLIVLLKMVPDIVEELGVAEDGKSLDASFLRMILNERDEHALEEALLLKERHGGTVSVLALDAPEIDDVLFTSLAKGADRAIKLTDFGRSASTCGSAGAFAQAVSTQPGLGPADLVLTGVQAMDDLDGLTAPLVSHRLGLPYLGLVTQVVANPSARTASVIKEFAGGVRGEFEVPLPAVLGIQAAEKPPRYVPVAKVRAVMKSQKIQCLSASASAEPVLSEVRQLAKAQVAGHAEMLEGTPEEIAEKVCGLLAARGL